MLVTNNKDWVNKTFEFILSCDFNTLNYEAAFNNLLIRRLVMFGDSFYACALNTQRRDFDQHIGQYIKNLSIDDFEKLIKFYVIIPKYIRELNRGSVNGAIWLIKLYKPVDRKRYYDLIDWVFKNRNNEYLPYGSFILLSIDSEAKYREFLDIKSEIKAINANQEKENHRLGVIRRAAKARENIKNAIKRNDLKAIAALQKTIDAENEFK